MISLFILIISLALSSLIFFIKEKKYAFTLSVIAILINSFFLFKRGLYYNFFVGTDIGYFGLTVNDLNYSFLVVILVVTAVTTVYSLRYMEEKVGEGSWGLYFGLYSLFAVSMLYVTISTNLLEVYVFLEISLITSFLLILLYGYGDRRRISLMYFIWTHIGTILLLASIIIIGLEFHTMNIYYSYGETNVFSSISFAELVFLLGVIGMLVKSAQAGLNIWLPYAHGEAPTPISVLLSPNLVGLGVYVIIFYFYLFPAFSYLAPIFIGWAVITMIYGGINALAQKDFKRFLAYSTVSQMGYMLLGSSTAYMLGLGQNVNQLPLGILSAVLIYASHGFGKAILFMSAGASITEFKTRNIEELGGLYLSSPLHSTLSFFGLLNILGLPPTVGFLSEVLLLLAIGQLVHVASLPLFILLVLGITAGIGISSGYSAYLFRKVYGGRKESKGIDKVIEYSIPMLLLAIGSAIFFFYPSFLSISINNFIQVLPSSSHLCLFLIVILPALGSLISLISGKLNQDVKGAIVSGLVGLSMVLAIYNLINAVTTPHPNFFVPAYTFTAFAYFQFSSSLLQAILAVFVSSLSFFIAIYSIGYMKEDSMLRRYWGFFGFFISSMLSVVLGDNILVFLAGWEGTSLASYGLISYWLDDNEKNVVGDFKRFVLGIEYLSKPTTSGIRALVFTRVGDVGMIIVLGYLLFLTTHSTLSGITVIYPVLHTSIQGLFSELPSLLPYSVILLIFLYLGGLSKSAQFPFTQWLVTAMTGPTPVSALIHAATMVNLGAIFTFLTYPFLIQGYSPSLQMFLEIAVGISMFTAIYTSLNALVSNEQKVILANSTADQISLMIFSSSLGGLLAIQLNNFDLVYAGIAIGLIQMIAHGIYKASLFMNAGSAIHYTESRYVGEYPNLYKKLKLLFVLQLFAALNLANIPLFIGFWAHSFISYLTSYNSYLDMTYLVLEFAGSVYIIRYVARLFMYGSGEKEAEGHISPIMYVSPAILIISSIILAVDIYPLVSFIEKGFSVTPSVFVYNNLDLIVSLVGIALAFIIYSGRMFNNRLLSPIINFFYYGWYVYPIFDIAGITSLKVSNAIFNYLETKGIDSSLNYRLPNGIIYYGGKLFNRLQNGLLRDYLGYYVGGIILLTLIVIILLLGD
ncbi:proton-conducting transporter membrane subunit [Acidianus sp. HS-5]|uniref:proton-conducting transporter transmembrane domain-containing protein n=1 Tax=Acidianus sp. HS-5 TaxID=2886040 RepID=UPI001F15DCB4|nr:proton-conducting transporter membrane subunit [Acidianus sp. HS-5]BDC19697.1 oxidoreductase [Acidianus sp. HS-5]